MCVPVTVVHNSALSNSDDLPSYPPDRQIRWCPLEGRRAFSFSIWVNVCVHRRVSWRNSNAVITIAIRLRYDYDRTMTYRAPASNSTQAKMNTSIFRRSRIVVLSQSNGTHIVISITSVVVECVVVSSYCSRIVVESQLWYRLNRDQRFRLNCRSMHTLNFTLLLLANV